MLAIAECSITVDSSSEKQFASAWFCVVISDEPVRIGGEMCDGIDLEYAQS